MARYGITPYDTDFYGAGVSALIATTMTTTPVGYGRLRVEWGTPGGQWSMLRLVRNQYGHPETVDDGVTLLLNNSGPDAVAPTDASVNQFLDGGLTQGSYFYYSLFVLTSIGTSITWRRSAIADGQAVRDYEYGRYLLDRLPGIHTTVDGEVQGQPDPGSALASFCNLLGYDLDRYRSALDHLLLLREPDRLYGALLPTYADAVGLEYEPEIGMRQNRVLLRNAAFLAMSKGTKPGALAYASALTGYGASQLAFRNLMLTQDDSSAEDSIGRWEITNGTLARDVALAPPLGDGVKGAVFPTGEFDPDGGFLQGEDDLERPGVFKVTATAATVTVNCGGSTASVETLQNSIPVVAGSSYTLSAYFRSPVTQRRPAVSILWRDKAGSQISASTSAQSTTGTVDTWQRASVTGTAPAGAVVATVQFVYTSAAVNEIQYFDAVQFERAGSASDYQGARQFVVALAAARVNEIKNGGFDANVAEWTASNSALEHETGITFNEGIGSAKVTPSAGFGLIRSATARFDPDAPISVGAQIRPVSNASIRFTLTYRDQAGTVLSTVTVPGTSCPAGQWTRVTYQGRSPVGTWTVQLDIGLASASNTGVFYVDDVLLRQADSLGNFFDLRQNPGEVVYEQPDGYPNGKIHYYPNLQARRARLLCTLGQYLPFDCNYSLRVAVPRGTALS